MSSKVVFQMTFSDESLSTHIAFVVSLPHVRFHVNIEISFLSEAVIANLTYEWLNAKMLSDMDVKSRLLRIADIAKIALEWLDQ